MTTTTTMPRAARPPRPPARENIRLVRKLFHDPPSVLDELCREFGPVVEVGPKSSPIVVIGSPEIIQEMFAAPEAHFAWRNRYNLIGLRFVVGGTSMLVSDGDHHRRRRSPVQPLFARRQLNSAIPVIVQHTDRALADLLSTRSDDAAERDLYPFGRLLLLGITVRLMFGERMATRTEEIAARYERPQAFVEAPAVRQLPHPLPFTERARVRRDRRALDGIVLDELERRQGTDPDGRVPDVLDVLVDDGTLTRQEILDQARTIIGAGYDTTASSLAWLLLQAAALPGLWDRLRAEADAVLGPVDQAPIDLGAETVAHLALASRTVRESLRLHPAGVIGVRLAATNQTLGRYRIRPGSLLAWSPHLAGRDEATWDQPLQFDPDRFLNLTTDQEASAHRAWVPFGRGPHACLGFALAQMELTLILARIAQTLDLTPLSPRLPAAHGLVVNRPEGGARLGIRPR